MSLVSNLFLIFVALSLLVYYIVPQKLQWIVLLVFSYIYYLAGGVRYVGFILFSTLVTWGIALAVEKAEAGGSHKSADQMNISCLDHGIGCFDSADQAAGLDHA